MKVIQQHGLLAFVAAALALAFQLSLIGTVNAAAVPVYAEREIVGDETLAQWRRRMIIEDGMDNKQGTFAEFDTAPLSDRHSHGQSADEALKLAGLRRQYHAHPPQNMEKGKAAVNVLKQQASDHSRRSERRQYPAHPPRNMAHQKAAILKMEGKEHAERRQYVAPSAQAKVNTALTANATSSMSASTSSLASLRLAQVTPAVMKADDDTSTDCDDVTMAVTSSAKAKYVSSSKKTTTTKKRTSIKPKSTTSTRRVLTTARPFVGKSTSSIRRATTTSRPYVGKSTSTKRVTTTTRKTTSTPYRPASTSSRRVTTTSTRRATTTAKPATAKKSTTTSRATTTSKPRTTSLSSVWTTSTSMSLTASVKPTTSAAGATSTVVPTSPVARAAAAYATVTTGGGSQLVLQSNDASYGYTELMSDLNSIMSWADDNGNLSDDQKKEVVSAILSGAARYWPDVPTRYIARIMLADIRTESDFRPGVVGAPRLDSGDSYGLLQLSPGAGSQEMPQFQLHGSVNVHNFTWGIDDSVKAGVSGALIDWETGKTLDASSLTNDDLYRPWINIHMGMWQQSNMARTASSDPWLWEGINNYSSNLKASGVSSLSSSQQSKWDSLLVGVFPAASRTPKTALGSWVAGPATNGNGSYLSSGDDISAQYFAQIVDSLNFLYYGAGSNTLTNDFLEKYAVFPGLVDYIS